MSVKNDEGQTPAKAAEIAECAHAVTIIKIAQMMKDDTDESRATLLATIRDVDIGAKAETIGSDLSKSMLSEYKKGHPECAQADT